MKKWIIVLMFTLIPCLAFGADSTIPDRTELDAAPAENDELALWDTTASAGRSISVLNFMKNLEAALTTYEIHIDNLPTIPLATLGTTVTCTDNESTAEDALVGFVDGATGAQGIETDGDLTYNPSTGTLSATVGSFDSIVVAPSTDPYATYDVTNAGETDWTTGVNADVGGDDNDNFEFRKSATPGTDEMLEIDPATGDLIFNGATDNAHKTTLNITDPTGSRTITVPDSDQTIGTATSAGANAIDSDAYTDDSIDNAHINWADIDNLGDEGLPNKVELDDDTHIDIMGDADGMDDDEYNGIVVSGLDAGEAIGQWDVVYLDNDTDPIWEADATVGSGEYPAFGIAVASATDTNPVIVLTQGVIRNEGWTGLTIGNPVYLGETDGALTQTAPSTGDDCVQIIGWAISDSEIYFDFSRPYQLVE